MHIWLVFSVGVKFLTRISKWPISGRDVRIRTSKLRLTAVLRQHVWLGVIVGLYINRSDLFAWIEGVSS